MIRESANSQKTHLAAAIANGVPIAASALNLGVAERTVARLGFDSSPDGERMRQYRIKCVNALHRGLAAYRKYHGKPKPERERPRFDYGRPAPEDSRLWIEDAGLWAPEITSADHLPDWSFDVNNAQPDECEQAVARGAPPDRGPESETGQRTNEPDFAENVAVVQGQQYVEVAAKVGVESALDKRMSLTTSGAADRQRSPWWIAHRIQRALAWHLWHLYETIVPA
jgi:hypothetical protein